MMPAFTHNLLSFSSLMFSHTHFGRCCRLDRPWKHRCPCRSFPSTSPAAAAEPHPNLEAIGFVANNHMFRRHPLCHNWRELGAWLSVFIHRQPARSVVPSRST